MRCECCNAPLSDKEATAKFARQSPAEPIRFVGMCTECMGYLPASVKILTRHDLEKHIEEYDREYDNFVDDFYLVDGEKDE